MTNEHDIDRDPDSELPSSLHRQIQDALAGDSNDAEHDALVAVAEYLGVDYQLPEY